MEVVFISLQREQKKPTQMNEEPTKELSNIHYAQYILNNNYISNKLLSSHGKDRHTSK